MPSVNNQEIESDSHETTEESEHEESEPDVDYEIKVEEMDLVPELTEAQKYKLYQKQILNINIGTDGDVEIFDLPKSVFAETERQEEMQE